MKEKMLYNFDLHGFIEVEVYKTEYDSGKKDVDVFAFDEDIVFSIRPLFTGVEWEKWMTEEIMKGIVAAAYKTYKDGFDAGKVSGKVEIQSGIKKLLEIN